MYSGHNSLDGLSLCSLRKPYAFKRHAGFPRSTCSRLPSQLRCSRSMKQHHTMSLRGSILRPGVWQGRACLDRKGKPLGWRAAKATLEPPPERQQTNIKIKPSKLGFPIRISAGQRLLAPHHGFSQPVTSFIASMRQGIHQMPFSHLRAPPYPESNTLCFTGVHAARSLRASMALVVRASPSSNPEGHSEIHNPTRIMARKSLSRPLSLSGA